GTKQPNWILEATFVNPKRVRRVRIAAGNNGTIRPMQTVVLALLMVLFQQVQPPDQPKSMKNDPNGIWQTSAGTKFEMKLTDSDLTVQLVAGSNPTYVKYEV